jgi:uncharacterized protein (DUF362 family)
MAMAGFEHFLPADRTTILKDNISWHLFFPGANTTPWQLDGVIAKLKASGRNDLVCVENETVVTRAAKGERLNKFTPVLEKHGVPVRFNFDESHMKWVAYEPRAKTRVLHRIFPEGIRIPDYFFHKNIVHLPTVKTHIYTTMTCSMKNAFGGLLNTKRHYTHSVIHDTLVDLLAIQKEIQSGLFAVADATTMGSGPGPRTMKPVVADLILASGDCVALDAVAASLMGFDPMAIGCIRTAHEAGLGAGRLDEIDIQGEDVRGLNMRFDVGDNMASRVGDVFWFSPLKRLQYLAFHTPLVYAFIFGSFVYHDFVWYPTIGRSRVSEWMKTPWGRLFERY